LVPYGRTVREALLRLIVSFFVVGNRVREALLRLIHSFFVVGNRVRYSRKEVVNDIKKHPTEVPKVRKRMPERGAGPPLWASLVPCDPKVLPGSTLEGFLVSFGRLF